MQSPNLKEAVFFSRFAIPSGVDFLTLLFSLET